MELYGQETSFKAIAACGGAVTLKNHNGVGIVKLELPCPNLAHSAK
jgi:hypothetical protein